MIPIVVAFILLGSLLGLLYLQRCVNLVTRHPTAPKFGTVLSVAVSSNHVFSKPPVESITLLANLGVEGDCHCGATVQHRSRLHIKPAPPNLRQVHLIQSDLFREFEQEQEGKSYTVHPGDLGENITTEGLDLLALGVGTRLHFLNPGSSGEIKHPIVRVTGLRNPCPQISNFKKGLQERCLVRDAGRNIVERKAGIMSVVEVGGLVTKGARVMAEMPEKYKALPCV
jgi:MOSC domain-containing protein YiiM